MDQQAVRVLAHFVPGEKVLEFLAPETDWLDIQWCADDDSPESQASFYRELPGAEVIWHVLRPLSGDDLRRGERLRLVQKLGAGVNTIDVETATKCGIAVANMPGANAPSVAEGTVLLMLAAMRRLPVLDRATRQGLGWPTDPELGESVRDIGACTVGLVGYGNIAKHVDRMVAAMGATARGATIFTDSAACTGSAKIKSQKRSDAPRGGTSLVMNLSVPGFFSSLRGGANPATNPTSQPCQTPRPG